MSDSAFDVYGADFCDPNGRWRSLHHINPARLRFIERFLSLSGKSILDVGCGGGILSLALAERGARVLGVDLSETVLQAARDNAQDRRLALEYQKKSSREVLETGARYDAVVCMEMLEHVQNPFAVLEDIYGLLRSGGWGFFSTLNRNPWSFLGAIVFAEYLADLVPKGTHTYQDFIRPEELVQMAEHAGFRAVALSGLDYHPWGKTAHLSRNLKINYLLAVQKP